MSSHAVAKIEFLLINERGVKGCIDNRLLSSVGSISGNDNSWKITVECEALFLVQSSLLGFLVSLSVLCVRTSQLPRH